MKVTNRTNLPKPLVDLAEELVNNHPVFENNRFSVTELLKSEQQIVLQRRMAEEIEMDVQDTFALWEGTAIHKLMEDTFPDEDYITEERSEVEISPNLFISGGFDCLKKDSWELIDYKNTKIPAINDALAGKDDKWRFQLYFYALLIERKYGKRPEKGTIIAMAKDFSRVKASTQAGYPQEPVQPIVYDLMDNETATEVFAFYKDKAESVYKVLANNEEPSPCTFGDMWCDENWAIIKKGGSRAIPGGVFDNPNDAYNHWCTLPDRANLRIWHRVKEPTNCRYYCSCRDFCKQWQSIKNNDMSISEDVTDKIIPF